MRYSIIDYRDRWGVHRLGHSIQIDSFQKKYYKHFPWLFPGCRLDVGKSTIIFQEYIGDESAENEFKRVHFEDIFKQLTEKIFVFPEFLSGWAKKNAEDYGPFLLGEFCQFCFITKKDESEDEFVIIGPKSKIEDAYIHVLRFLEEEMVGYLITLSPTIINSIKSLAKDSIIDISYVQKWAEEVHKWIYVAPYELQGRIPKQIHNKSETGVSIRYFLPPLKRNSVFISIHKSLYSSDLSEFESLLSETSISILTYDHLLFQTATILSTLSYSIESLNYKEIETNIEANLEMIGNPKTHLFLIPLNINSIYYLLCRVQYDSQSCKYTYHYGYICKYNKKGLGIRNEKQPEALDFMNYYKELLRNIIQVFPIHQIKLFIPFSLSYPRSIPIYIKLLLNSICDYYITESSSSLNCDIELFVPSEKESNIASSRLSQWEQEYNMILREIPEYTYLIIGLKEEIEEFYRYIRGKENKNLNKQVEEEIKNQFVSETPILSVLSYNTLARKYCSNSYFPECPPGSLKWNYRLKLIIKYIEMKKPSFICLQECDCFFSSFLPYLTRLHYKGVFFKRTGTKLDGCAVFYNRDILDEYSIDYSHFYPIYYDELQNYIEENENEEQKYIEENKIQLLKNQKQQYYLRKNIGLIVVFKYKGMYMLVNTTHLFWDPHNPDIKLEQSHLFNYSIYKVSNHLIEEINSRDQHTISIIGSSRDEENKKIRLSTYSYYNIPIIITMDSNSLPYSEVYNYWRFKNPYFKTLKSAYETYFNDSEPLITNYTTNFVGTLDYIWYTSKNLCLLFNQSLPSNEELYLSKCLPDLKHPSDHLPLMSHFQFFQEDSGHSYTSPHTQSYPSYTLEEFKLKYP